MIFDDDEDKERARRRWNAHLAAVDAEIAEEARERARRRPAVEPDVAKALDLPSPWVWDYGPETPRADREAWQAEQDRWTRWEKEGR